MKQQVNARIDFRNKNGAVDVGIECDDPCGIESQISVILADDEDDEA